MNFLALGEIIWDIFENGKTLGGAPLNVAAHMASLQANSSIISKVGRDELGDKALEEIKNYNINIDFIKRSSFSTGIANIYLENGIPSYSFNTPCAWDDIEVDDIDNIDVDVFCYGSLSQRMKGNEKLARLLLDKIKAKLYFFDVNIRKEFYDEEFILFSLQKCNIFKLNDEEVSLISNISGIEYIDENSFITKIANKYKIDTILVTKGKDGIKAFNKGVFYIQKTEDVKVVDTVGAGDSFSAGFLRCFYESKDIEKSLKMGSLLADYVVSHKGAIPIYDDKLKQEINKIIHIF